MGHSERSHGRAQEILGGDREDLEDSCVGYYLLRVADLITCCFPERQEHPPAKRQKTEDRKYSSRRPSGISRKRKASIPISRYNSSICNDQPPRRSQLLWLASRDGTAYPVPQVPRYQSGMVSREQEMSGRSMYENPERGTYVNVKGQTLPKTHRVPDPPCQPGVIGDPDALINRPKSAYTRNLRTTDEEPVFWQHSHRATSRFRQSQFSTHQPMRPLSTRQSEPRHSTASDFEHLLEKTFSPSSNLNLQPNPIINIEPPKTSYLPLTPTEDPQLPQNTRLPPSPNPTFSPSQRPLSQNRFSGYRPLQLSFYLPGNRLSLLPRFNDEHDLSHDIPPVPEVARPASALIIDKPSLKLDPPLSAFSIPRKAVGSRVSSGVRDYSRTSSKSSVTLVGMTSSRGSILEEGPSSQNILNRKSWSIKRDTLRDVGVVPTSMSRPATYCPSTIAKYPSGSRMSAPTMEVQIRGDLSRQNGNEYPTIYEETSPVSSVSSVSVLSGEYPPCANEASTPSYHEYEYAAASHVPERPSTVDYYDYEFVGEARHVPSFSKSHFERSSLQVAPLFNSSVSSSDCSDEELSPPSKVRSSLGSSTLFHGESSPESDMPAVKTTLSIAFPSPTLQHRLSEWLSRSASQMPVISPKHGECYGHADSPTLGFSWKDFGFQAEERSPVGTEKINPGRDRAFTDSSSISTYIDGDGMSEARKFPMSTLMGHSVNVGIAF